MENEEQLQTDMDRSSKDNEHRLEQIQAVKNKQRGALSALTKCKNQLRELMSNSDNLGEVKQKCVRFKELYSNYTDCMNALMKLLQEDEHEEEIARYQDRVKPVISFKTELTEWISTAENQIYEQLDNESVRPKSSTSRRSSSRSNTSTTSSMKRERAKLAELLAEKEMEAKQQEKKREMEAHQREMEAEMEAHQREMQREMEREMEAHQREMTAKLEAHQREMEAKQKEMKLDTEIAKARARSEAYAESSTRSATGRSHKTDVTKPVFDSRSHDIQPQIHEQNTRQTETNSGEDKLKQGNVAAANDHVDFDARKVKNQTKSRDDKPEQNISNRNISRPSHPVAREPDTSLSDHRYSALECKAAHEICHPDQHKHAGYYSNDRNNSQQHQIHYDSRRNYQPSKTYYRTAEADQARPEIPNNSRRLLDPNAPEFPALSHTAPSHVHASDLLLQKMIAAMHLPTPEVPKFRGDVTEYTLFIRAFDARIVPFVATDADKLYYLEQLLEGEAKDCIGGCLYMEPADGYNEARNLLDCEYGDPFKVSTAYVNTLLNWPSIKSNTGSNLKKLSVYLTKCLNAMRNIHYMTVLNHTPNIQTIILKLPVYLQNKWKDNVNRIRKRNNMPTFADVCEFVKEAENIANDPAFGTDALQEHNTRINHSTLKQKTNIFSTIVDDDITATATQSILSTSAKCAYCKCCHDVEECELFIKLTLEDRKTWVKENRLCFGCFESGHISKFCVSRRTCSVCNRKHPTALHDPSFNMQQVPKQPEGNESSEQEVSGNASVNQSDVVLQAILPVKVRVNNSRSITTYAFLDNGSTGCFITENLKDQLNAKSTDATLKLRTVNGVNYVKTEIVTDLIVTDTHNNYPVTLPKAYTREEIPATHKQIPKPDMLKQWPHLRDLANRIPEYYPTLDIGILIGNNCPLAIQPLKVIPTEGEGPFAVLYRHGWTINGPYRVSICADDITCNRILFQELESMKESALPAEILRMMEFDFSERDIGKVPGECGCSLEDEQFMQIAKQNIRFVDGHYELPLPFKKSKVPLPNNRQQALKRALWQKKTRLPEEVYYPPCRRSTILLGLFLLLFCLPFVANRIRTIHDFSTPDQWRYVNTKSNPADCPSLGLDGQQIQASSMWMNGPEFVQKTSFEKEFHVLMASEDDAQDERGRGSSKKRLLKCSSIYKLDPFMDKDSGVLRVGGRLARMEYIATLQERQKWNYKGRNIQINDIVLVKEENVSTNAWCMGRVCETEKDKQGYVRSVVLKTQHSELRRPISKLIVLLTAEDR